MVVESLLLVSTPQAAGQCVVKRLAQLLNMDAMMTGIQLGVISVGQWKVPPLLPLASGCMVGRFPGSGLLARWVR